MSVRKRFGAYRIRLTMADGSRQELTSSKTTLKEAREEDAQLVLRERAKRLGTYAGSDSITVAEAFAEYSKGAQRKGGWKQVESRFENHILPALGTKRLVQISPASIEELLAQKEAEGYAPETVRHIRTRLVVLFNWAKRARLFSGDNPAELSEAPEVPLRDPHVLPADMVQDVIDAVPDLWRPFFALAVYTGLRCGELRALVHGDVDPDHRGLRVSKSGTRKSTKTGRDRFVPLPAAALPYLRTALERSRARPWLFVDAEGRQVSRHVKFPLILRQALQKLGLVTTYTVFCQRGCGVRVPGVTDASPWNCPGCGYRGKVEPEFPLTFHDLRKTWETHLERLTKDVVSVARLAGHSADVAMRRYLGKNDEELHALAQALDFKKLSPTVPRRGPEPERD